MNTSEPAPATKAPPPAGVSLWADARRRLLKNKLAVFGLILIVLVTLSAVFASVISPIDPETQHFWIQSRPPMFHHPDVRNEASIAVGEPLNPREVCARLANATGTHTVVFDLRRLVTSEYRVVVNDDGTVSALSITTGAQRVADVAVQGPQEYFEQIGSDGQPANARDGTPTRIRNATVAKGQPLPAGFTRTRPTGRWVLIMRSVNARAETLTARLANGRVQSMAIAVPNVAADPNAPPLRKTDLKGEDVVKLTLDGDELRLTHPLGTDKQGRDLFARTLYGGQISLMVAFLATLVSLLIGVLYGAISGYKGGLTDQIMMRIVDILYGLPYIFLVIILMVAFGKSLVVLFIALGAVQWLTMARIVRGQVLSLKEKEFVQAALTTGASTWAIVTRHLIPNVLGVVVVYTTLTIPAVVLQESFLAFIGLGVQYEGRNLASWGALVKDGMDNLGTTSAENWWLLVVPSIVMSATLFAFNFVGDGLRDALDPQQKGRT